MSKKGPQTVDLGSNEYKDVTKKDTDMSDAKPKGKWLGLSTYFWMGALALAGIGIVAFLAKNAPPLSSLRDGVSMTPLTQQEGATTDTLKARIRELEEQIAGKHPGKEQPQTPPAPKLENDSGTGVFEGKPQVGGQDTRDLRQPQQPQRQVHRYGNGMIMEERVYRPDDELIAAAGRGGSQWVQGNPQNSRCFKVTVHGQPKIRCPNKWVHGGGPDANAMAPMSPTGPEE